MDLNSNTIVLGVDVGGSHITSALINSKEGTIIENSVRREHVNAYGEAGRPKRDRKLILGFGFWSEQIEVVCKSGSL